MVAEKGEGMHSDKFEINEFGDIFAFAERGKSEDWDNIEEWIANNPDDEKSNEWAFGYGLSSSVENLRDLAANVIEFSSKDLTEEEMQKLIERRDNKDGLDKEPYVAYRSSCALFVRGDRSPETISHIRARVDDPEEEDVVKEHAQSLLDQIKEQK